MKTNYTSGPWHTTQSVNVATSKGKILAFTSDRMVNSKGGISAFNHEERKANAALISAAPELLDALKEMIKVLEAGIDNKADQKEFDNSPTVKNALSAIAKAEGNH